MKFFDAICRSVLVPFHQGRSKVFILSLRNLPSMLMGHLIYLNHQQHYSPILNSKASSNMLSYRNPSFNLNILLACHKCGTTMDDLYEADIDWNECNLLDGTDNKGIKTKLWMTSCGHIICYKHLPGGKTTQYNLNVLPLTSKVSSPSILSTITPRSPAPSAPQSTTPIYSGSEEETTGNTTNQSHQNASKRSTQQPSNRRIPKFSP